MLKIAGSDHRIQIHVTNRGNEDQFYNYIRGLWLDGNPLTFGGTGYAAGATNVTQYAFPDDPNDRNGWSMCTTALPNGDRRTMQATGPLTLQPGATNELITGIVLFPILNTLVLIYQDFSLQMILHRHYLIIVLIFLTDLMHRM